MVDMFFTIVIIAEIIKAEVSTVFPVTVYNCTNHLNTNIVVAR